MDVPPSPSPPGPLVTVGIPTYNRPAGLDRTLRQIRAQTYTNLEILVSDNCSTAPETRAVAAAHQQADPRVRYHRQEQNIGLEGNFKYLLQNATGEFFFWAADDDEWAPEFVAVCLEHIGTAGSVMTGMRNAVRPLGLLRWKPPLHLSPDNSPFENAVAFLTNAQPSLFYGVHRTEQLRAGFLPERVYDYYDYFFIVRQILTHGFRTAAPVCFHVGIDAVGPVYKPARPRAGAIYEYLPFLRDALRAVRRAPGLGAVQKVRLAFLLCYVALNEFSWFEREVQPRRTRLAELTKRAMRFVRPLFAVPLPPPPPTMVLPDDPAELCTMFVPHATLSDRDALAAAVETARTDLVAKLTAIGHLEAGARLAAPRFPRTDPALLAPAAPDEPLDELRRRLGSLLRQLEDQEGYVRTLVPLQKPHRAA